MELSDYLKIGEVCEVQGKNVKAGIYSDKNTEYLNYNGSVIKNVGIGSFILIRKGFNNIIGKVDGEYTRENTSIENNYYPKGNSIKRIISISILGGMNLDESQGFSFYDKNVKLPYVIQNREYYGLKDFRLVMRI